MRNCNLPQFLYVFQRVNMVPSFDNSHQYLGIPKCPREILCIPPQSIVSWLRICPFTSPNHTSIYHEHPWTSINIHQHSSTSPKKTIHFVPSINILLFTKKKTNAFVPFNDRSTHRAKKIGQAPPPTPPKAPGDLFGRLGCDVDVSKTMGKTIGKSPGNVENHRKYSWIHRVWCNMRVFLFKSLLLDLQSWICVDIWSSYVFAKFILHSFLFKVDLWIQQRSRNLAKISM